MDYAYFVWLQGLKLLRRDMSITWGEKVPTVRPASRGNGLLTHSYSWKKPSPCVLVVILGRWFKYQMDGGITGFEILFRTVQCFGISSSYKSYKIWEKVRLMPLFYRWDNDFRDSLIQVHSSSQKQNCG